MRQVKRANYTADSSSPSQGIPSRPTPTINMAAPPKHTDTVEPEITPTPEQLTPAASTRKRKNSPKKKTSLPSTESIVISDREDDSDEIVASGNEEDYEMDTQGSTRSSRPNKVQPPSRKSRQTTTVGKSSSGSRSKSTKTPKTDILSSLLARKRK